MPELDNITDEDLDFNLQRSIYVDSYYEFFKDAFHESLDPVSTFQDNWHIKYLCDLLQEEIERIGAGIPKSRDLIINIPPRSLKSLICTVGINAWAWIKFPWMKFISASYSAQISITLSRQTRELITCPWYQKYFGDVFAFNKDQDAKSYFINTEKGFRRSTSTGASITGDGGDVLIGDDLIKPSDAYSILKNEAANNWFTGTLYNRLNNHAIGLRIIIMQRVGAHDLTQHLLGIGGYRLVKIPSDDTFPVPEEYQKHYRNGYFFPARFNEGMLADIKRNMSDRDHASQYGQSPLTDEGMIFKESDFPCLTIIPDKFLHVYQSWDTAFKTGLENSRSVCITFAQLPSKKFLILDVFKGHLDFNNLKMWAKDLFKLYKPEKVFIEDKASGQSIIQELRRETLIPVEALKVDTDKLSKAWASSGYVENGYILVPDEAAWKSEFFDELTRFPEYKYDDQVDAFTNFVVHKVKEASFDDDYFIL